MAEYIDKDIALNLISNRLEAQQRYSDYYDGVHCGLERALGIIEDIPVADVVPVKHTSITRDQVEKVWKGEWIDKPSGRYGQWQTWCSACGKHSGIGGIKSNRHRPFCPNCGAPMTDEAVDMLLKRLEALHGNR